MEPTRSLTDPAAPGMHTLSPGAVFGKILSNNRVVLTPWGWHSPSGKS